MPTTIDGSGNVNGVQIALATQAEAQAGTDNTKLMTPLRVADQFDANAASEYLTAGEIVSGSPQASLNISLSGYSGFRQFQLHLLDLVPVINGAQLLMRISTDGGTTWLSTAGYRTFGSALSSGSTAVGSIANTATGTAFSLTGVGGIGNTSGKEARGSLNFAARTDHFSCQGHFAYELATAVEGIQAFPYGFRAVNANAVQIYLDNGNISTLTWALYGMR